jgi:hypothetical protein
MSSMPVGAAEFQRTLPERMRREIMKAGKFSTVPSQGLSRAAEVVVKAEDPVRLERSKGAFDEKGSRTMAWAYVAVVVRWQQ